MKNSNSWQLLFNKVESFWPSPIDKDPDANCVEILMEAFVNLASPFPFSMSKELIGIIAPN